MVQTYENYFKYYIKTENGRAARRRAQARYRAKLKAKWGGIGAAKAAMLERESKRD